MRFPALPAALFLVSSLALADGPATAIATTTVDTPEAAKKVEHFKGFDLTLDTFESTGLSFASESYYNVLSVWLQPSYAVGKRIGGFWEPLTIGSRLPIDVEFTSNDPRFRGPHYGSSALYSAPDAPASLASGTAVPVGNVDGAERRPIQLGDTWLTLVHPRLYKIPKADVQIGSGLRFVLPTSPSSRNAGMIFAPTLGVFFDRELGPATLSYAVRGGHYFFSRTSAPVAGSNSAVNINGANQTLWQPSSTGIPNPEWMVVQGLSADFELPKHLNLSLNYFLFHTRPFALSGCAVPDVPTANVCTDGALVGQVSQVAWRNDQWFLASVGWKHDPFAVSLGLSTYRSLRATDGSIGEPFFYVTRENATTVFLSFTTSAEQIASAL